ncbi:aminoacyl-tRNA hydrolase [Malassezia psittaci]|uniref:Aminoacyl-tRNA hydrolase n=1 Tax=Malassezia psittaci TaxID=1821823 RepID=A0AAF0FA26_9BASI|nr:aminoacyl-tRNA hydrolase [Malassezia psittaci]
MLRGGVAKAWKLVRGSPQGWFSAYSRSVTSLARTYATSHIFSEWDLSQRRTWIEQFRARTLETSQVQIAFARSSGPGGQNVNKLNTKVQARYPLAQSDFPRPLLRALATSSPLYISSSHALQVTSERNRSQAQNVQDALKKVRDIYLIQLHAEILRVAQIDLPGETSQAQQDRVKRLAKRHNEHVKKQKQMRSLTKSLRRAKS